MGHERRRKPTWGMPPPQQSTPARLRVGCAPHLGAQRLQSFLGACYPDSPELDVEVFHLPSEAQRHRLRSEELHLGLIDAAGTDPAIETQPLFPGDALAVFLPVHHPLAARERLDADMLAGLVLLTRPRTNDPHLHEA